MFSPHLTLGYTFTTIYRVILYALRGIVMVSCPSVCPSVHDVGAWIVITRVGIRILRNYTDD